MNPYEGTVAEMKRQSEGPKRLAKTVANIGLAAGTAAGAASFAPILARAAPFLSQYIPEGLAIKGLTKINPKLGAFIKSAIDSGYDFQQVKDFIGQQITGAQGQPAKDNRNVIEQHSPELNTFLSEKIKGGEDPIKAAALALFEKGNPFEPVIRKIEKEHKTNWSQLVQSIYGGGQGQGQGQPPAQKPQQQAPQGQTMQPQAQGGQQADPLFQALMQGDAGQVAQLAGVTQPQAENLIQKFNQSQGSQQQQPQQGGGQGAQALQAILQKINQRLGG